MAYQLAPLSALLQAEVDYPRPHVPVKVPAEHLAYTLRLLVERLGLSIQLEEALNAASVLYFDTVRTEGDDKPDEGAYKLTGLIATASNWTDQLGSYDTTAAQSEVASWNSRGIVYSAVCIYGHRLRERDGDGGCAPLSADAAAGCLLV